MLWLDERYRADEKTAALRATKSRLDLSIDGRSLQYCAIERIAGVKGEKCREVGISLTRSTSCATIMLEKLPCNVFIQNTKRV
ncbi:MAG: hypothetical protein VR73_09635 [Gammaproteobacteria bacterium BRH_c0]|nr:MAG: hypothetical protein VR73_09635 [Gammaproteobacteria bacterium BRH_c0]